MKEIKIDIFVKKNEEKSKNAKMIVEKVTAEMENIRINVLDIEEEEITALTYHIIKSPSICINGLTRFHGNIPNEEALRSEILKAQLM
ncbi:thioredoxin family protein [Candidatus Woesearchaeota archaeon]|nr:thioredoxin family protein [Candidatus Woesearchaeota archaeon]